jgi:hypothetical protein
MAFMARKLSLWQSAGLYDGWIFCQSQFGTNPFKSTMTLLIRLISIALASTLSVSVALAGGAHQNDVARYLAGLAPAPQSTIHALTQEPAWATHSEQMSAAWERLERRQLQPVRAWSAAHLGPPSPTLLYMFSGPDYLYARNFFPDASTYVLAGLEPPGRMIQPGPLSAEDRQRGLENLRESLRSILDASFFITADMLKDLQGHAFSGVMPLLYVFLARSGMEITAVRHLGLTEDGGTVTLPAPARVRPNGIEINFRDREKAADRKLFYFSIDLSNVGLADGAFIKFIERLGPSDAFFKSASYLPHAENFLRIRSTVMQQSVRILQDDTGVPLAGYDPNIWQVTPFGRYTRPIQMFDYMHQPALTRLFEQAPAAPLNFRLGYGYGIDTTGILLATRRAPR